jgi:hypothetical protein
MVFDKHGGPATPARKSPLRAATLPTGFTPAQARRQAQQPGRASTDLRQLMIKEFGEWLCSRRLHGIGPAMHAAWQAGVVLMGVSAGSVCWFAGGTTDAFGLPLRPVTDALGFLPYSNSPHHDAEEQRRPAIHRLIG